MENRRKDVDKYLIRKEESRLHRRIGNPYQIGQSGKGYKVQSSKSKKKVELQTFKLNPTFFEVRISGTNACFEVSILKFGSSLWYPISSVGCLIVWPFEEEYSDSP